MGNSTMVALGMIVVGGILIYSAFQTPPDPREVLKTAFRGGASSGSAKAPPHTSATVDPRQR